METGPDVMRRRRKALKLTQGDLAPLADLSMQAVSQIERGINVPRRSTAERIDVALEADGDVLRGFGYVAAPRLASPSPLDDDVLARLERLEHAVALIAHRLDRSFDQDRELIEVLDELATERRTRGRAAP